MRAIVVTLVVGACACRSGQADPERTGARIVSLHDVTTEVIVALGAVDRMVGVAEPVDMAPDAERAIDGVREVGGLESIVAAAPDLVVGLHVVAEQDPELVRALEERGITVLLPSLGRLEDLEALVRELGLRLGEPEAAERVLASLQARVDTATVTPARRPRVLVYDCCDPPFTAGARTVEHELIARAGGTNVFGDVDAGWTHVSWEEAVARAPELIVVHAYAWDGQGDVDAKRAHLAAIPRLGGVPVEVVPLGEVLGGLRSIDGLERLRRAIERLP
jgi:iron complex transport system substrate-binding protein